MVEARRVEEHMLARLDKGQGEGVEIAPHKKGPRGEELQPGVRRRKTGEVPVVDASGAAEEEVKTKGPLSFEEARAQALGEKGFIYKKESAQSLKSRQGGSSASGALGRRPKSRNR